MKTRKSETSILSSDGNVSRAAEAGRRFVIDGTYQTIVMAIADSKRIRQSWGWSDGGKEMDLLVDRPFAIASITKAVAGVLFACLMDEGLLRFEDPLVKYLPVFGNQSWRKTVTIGNIFTHSNGLQEPDFVSYVKMDLDPREGHAAIFGATPLFVPGTHFQYSTLTYQLLNDVASSKLGMHMSALMKSRIFDSCEMKHTSFAPPAAWHPIPCLKHPLTDTEHLRRFTDREVSGGGLWSTAGDLVRMGQSLLSFRLMRRKAFDQMTQSQPALPFFRKAGCSWRTWGWNREKQVDFVLQPSSGFYHGGATGSVLWIDPDQDLIFVFITDRWSGDNSQAFTVLNKLYEGSSSQC